MKRTIYLHVGFHKTATTFLQWNIFRNIKKLNVIRKKHARSLFRRVRLKKLDDEDVLEIRQAFDKKGSDKSPTLISYEGLTGSPFTQKNSKSAYRILDDLRRIFPDDRYDVYVIVGIRKQVDLLTSLYTEFLRQGGYVKENEYFRQLEQHGVLDHYRYNEYLDHVEQLFGEDHFLFIFENFKADKNRYLRELLRYMGINRIPEHNDEQLNRSYGVFQAWMARKLNRIFKTPKNPDGFIPEVKIKLKRKYSQKLVRKLLGKKRKKLSLFPRTLLQNKISYKIHYKKYQMDMERQAYINAYFKRDNEKLAQREGVELPGYYLEP